MSASPIERESDSTGTSIINASARIKNVGDPVDSRDAVTKAYADASQANSSSPITTFDQLVAAVAAAPINAVLRLSDAVFNFTDTLTITKPITLLASRSAYFMNLASLAKPLVAIELTAQTAEANVSFKRINLSHLTATYDNVTVNNTTVNQNLKVWFEDCNSEIASSTGSGLNISQADATKTIIVRVQGRDTHRFHNVKTACANSGDLIEFGNMRVYPAGSATYGVATTGSAQGTVSFKYSEFKAGAAAGTVSGTAQAYSAQYCWTDNLSGTLAVFVAGDLTSPAGGPKILP